MFYYMNYKRKENNLEKKTMRQQSKIMMCEKLTLHINKPFILYKRMEK